MRGSCCLLDYYLHTAAVAAEERLARQTRPGPPAPMPMLVASQALDDAGQAMAWARAERDSLLACLSHVTRAGQHARVIALTAALAELLQRDGPWTEAITRHATAVQSARHLDDRPGQAGALSSLGNVRHLTGDYAGAAGDLEQALAIYRDLGDRLCQAEVLNRTGTLRQVTGERSGAEACHQQALELARATGGAPHEARALAGLGRCAAAAGHATQARTLLLQALEIFQRNGAAEAPALLAEVNALTSQGPQG